MSKKDVFAGIAAGGAAGRKDLLEETFPLEKSSLFFAKSNKKIESAARLDYKQQLEEYYSGIEALKKQYAPFLERKCGPEKTNRTKQFIETFRFRFEDDSETQNISVPHYTGPKGRWTAYYETEFTYNMQKPGRRVFLVFKGVDYYADVYVNDVHTCSHEGFFATFETDVTELLKESNTLIVKVGNDIPTIGNGDMQVNGDKLYAATGLGWDDSEEGWHHCPAGGGIFDKVYIEERDSLYIEDIFIRPDINSGTAQVNISVYSPYEENTEINLSGDILPYNFESDVNNNVKMKVIAGYGLNFYSFTAEIQNARLWEPETPYLYMCRATAENDTVEKTFGMRKFHMDSDSEPKGSLFLNDRPVLLRGANEMGHLQLCVARDDFDQLIEDILIAKYCNMNYYRITQRPVQEEIYHYCDMLGMMNQVDLPLFGYMRKNKFHEGVKQAGEMERLVRNHPSVIMATYINEPFAPDKYGLGYRHMSRPELELFFDACDAALKFENPDRVIKRVEGDYDPPTDNGMSDFHCYNMWYTNHALPIGMLYKGYLPALNKGWKTGCGEYGTEGLDNYKVMRKYYPSEWLPENDMDKWIPDKIIKAQTNTMHGDWYEEQDNIHDWIEKSQEHQAFATEMMTLSMRRRADRIVSTAIHLLIDAWPSGWMKTLLDVDRVPKKAYFSFKESLETLKVNLRCDRWSVYSEENIDVEAWLLNDGGDVTGLAAVAGVFIEGCQLSSYETKNISAGACSAYSFGLIPVKIPKTKSSTDVTISISLFKGDEIISQDSFIITAYSEPRKSINAYPVGNKAKKLIDSTHGLTLADMEDAEAIIISSVEEIEKTEIEKGVKKLFLTPEGAKKTYRTESREYTFRTIFDPDEVGENGELKGLSFVATSDEIKKVISNKAFSYWYNSEKDVIDHVAEYFIDCNGITVLAHGYEKPAWGGRTSGKKKKLPVAAFDSNGAFISLETSGRSGLNPALDRLVLMMLTKTSD